MRKFNYVSALDVSQRACLILR